MKRFIFLFGLMLLATPAFAEKWICYDVGSVPANQITVRVQGDCLALGICTGPNNTGILPNCFKAENNEYNLASEVFKKVDPLASPGDRIIDWTLQEITDYLNIQDLNADLAMRSSAKAQYNGQTPDGQALRCFAKIVMDEVNILRDWTLDFKGEVAASTNLGNLQSRVATLPDLNPRSLSQLKTSIQDCIDSGVVDE